MNMLNDLIITIKLKPNQLDQHSTSTSKTLLDKYILGDNQTLLQY